MPKVFRNNNHKGSYTYHFFIVHQNLSKLEEETLILDFTFVMFFLTSIPTRLRRVTHIQIYIHTLSLSTQMQTNHARARVHVWVCVRTFVCVYVYNRSHDECTSTRPGYWI